MKPLSHLGIALAVILSFSACDPKPKPAPKPVPGPTAPNTGTTRPTDPVVSPTNPRDPGPPTATNPVVPEQPRPKPVEYAVKLEGKNGYVTSPYDPQKRAIDVRGLPPGTEVEDPYNPGRTLLVP